MKSNFTIRLRFVLFLAFFSGIYSNSSAQCLVTTGPTNNCSYGDAIDLLTINGITASNPGCSNGSGYSSFASPTWTFFVDSVYSIAANVGGSTYDQGLAIWIDVNNNGQYEASEQLYASASASLTHLGSFTIPSTSVTGIPVPMRVMCVYNQVIPAGNACTSSQNTYGETEDYMVVLTVPSPVDEAEASSVILPQDNACGNVSENLTVRISNNGSNDLNDVPFEVNLSGMLTATYLDTVPLILAGDFVDAMVTTINTEAGGTLNVEFITNLAGDTDTSNDTLTTSLTILDGTDLVISGMTSGCTGDMLTLTGNTTLGMDTAVWYADGIYFDSANVILTDMLTADIEFVLTSSNSCRANDTINITLTAPSTGSFTAGTTGSQTNFTGTATDFVSISWDYGDGTGTGTGINSSYSYAGNGNYYVCMTVNGVCDTLVYCDSVAVNSLGITDLDLGDVAVFPNPTSGMVTISLNNLSGFNGTWSLIDLAGKVIESKEISISSKEEQIQVSLESIKAGSYIFRLKSNDGYTYQLNLIKN